MLKSGLSLAAIVVAGVLAAGAATAADYPASSVRLLVPASPGGSTDVDARVFAEFFTKHSGAAVAVVNQPAGGGVVAAQTLSTGPKDGSVIYLWHAAFHTANLFGQSPFSYKDWTPLATVADYNDVYAVRADAPYSTIPELVEYAKAHPNEVTIGSQFGGTTQVKGEALNGAADKTMRLVDAGGESDRITALLGEQVDVISMSVANAKQYSESGKMKVLAVINEKADPFAPDWPTTKSQGVDISFPLVFTVYGPGGMDADAVAAFDAVTAEMKADPAYAEALQKASQVPDVRNSGETKEFLDSEFAFVKTLLGK